MAVPHLGGTLTSEYAKVGVVVYHYTVWPYHFQTACYSPDMHGQSRVD